MTCSVELRAGMEQSEQHNQKYTGRGPTWGRKVCTSFQL